VLLKELIQAKGFKQKWLAAKIGVSEVTMSNWVKEKSCPKNEYLIRLSELLDVPVDQLRLHYGK